MRNKMLNRAVVGIIGAVWCILALFVWITPSAEISLSERRKLAQFPQITFKSLIMADFMEKFEQYAKDQFPYRFSFRTAKAYTRFYIFGQKDNNGVYMKDGYAVKLEYPLNEDSIRKATDKFGYLYEKYMKDKNIKTYLAVVPDKGYFLSGKNGYPSMDYKRLFEIMEKNTDFAKLIRLEDILEIDDYYKTDIHWDQEKILKVSDKIKEAIGIGQKNTDYKTIEVKLPFYGVYYGHSALPMKPDRLRYLTNDIIERCTVYNIETGKTAPVYDTEKLSGNDPYDVYLSGAASLLVIENPSVQNGKELVVFRDSFGSSLAPLLLDSYSKITMIDIRYISSDLIGEYVAFDNQDVLFLYSTSVLNSSSMFK